MEDLWTLVTNKFKHSCFATKSSHLPPSSLPQASPVVIAKGDSAASKHYFKSDDKHILVKVKFDANGPTVILPNSSWLKSFESGELPISTLISALGKKTAIFDELHSSLISLGQLCDDNCVVVLGKYLLEVIKDNKVVLRGPRSTSGDGLWDIPLPQAPDPTPTLLNINPTPRIIPPSITQRTPTVKPQSLNVIIRKDKSHQDLVQYLHAAAFSPTHNTFIQAIKRNFLLSWPGLTVELVKKHLPVSIHTAKGHLNQEKSGLQSTRHKPSPEPLAEDMYPIPNEPNLKTNDVV